MEKWSEMWNIPRKHPWTIRFVICINNMLDVVGSNIKMFAGNDKIYSMSRNEED